MSTKVEIAKRQSVISTNTIEKLIKDLIIKKVLDENSLIRLPSKRLVDLDAFAEEIHSITTNKITVS